MDELERAELMQELQELLREDDLDAIADWAYDFLGDDYIPADENTRIKSLVLLKLVDFDGCTLDGLMDWANDFLNFYLEYLNEGQSSYDCFEGQSSLFQRLTEFSLN
jgi:hypothetical protein